MSSGFIDISVDYDGTTVGGAPVLTSVAQRLEDLTPALEQIAEDYRDREQVAFATAGFGTWAFNAPSTLAAKVGNRPLIDSGGLLVSYTRRGARYNVARLTNDELILGSRSPVARLAKAGPRGMPKRNPSPPTTQAERDRMTGGLAVYVVEGSTS